MSKIYIAKRRREDNNGKVYWDETGLKVFEKQDGRLSLFDGRTGEWYSLFEPKQKEDQQVAPQDSGSPFNDDIGF